LYIITFSAIWRQSHRGKYLPRPGKVGLRNRIAPTETCIIQSNWPYNIHAALIFFYLQ
jgi:hypothetical protein